MDGRTLGMKFKDLRVTVVGLGRFGGGIGVTRWLCGQGAKVTISDKAKKEELTESIRALGGLDVEFHLGGHLEEDFLDAELLVINPAVSPQMPLLEQAIINGVLWTTEMNLFLERCSAPIVGITGSVGKSTTTAMVGEILATKYTTHVGGNIGRSLLDMLDEFRPDHVVVLELSSFQLEQLPMVRVADTGISCVIDRFGRIRQELHGADGSTFIEGILEADVPVPLAPEQTFYTRHGDLFAHVCLALTIAASLAAFLMRRRSVANGL